MDRHDAAHRAAGRLRRRRAAHPRRSAQADGTYRIKGTKIFITYGEHDMTDNIVHFVLARLPDAPAGTRGISLFLVPKFMVNADGSLGARNDIFASGVEHKLGMHASPTCTMTMGDHGGAIGFLIGEENQGMRCMFTMMNQARLGVGLEGVGVADRAYQQALAYAQERKQGRAVGNKGDGSDAIFVHPDVKRMLMRMRAQTAAARTICYCHRGCDRRLHARQGSPRCGQMPPRARALLTPIGKGLSPPMSATRSPISACRCMAAWASSRKPARRSTIAMRASPRSTRAPTASRRSTS